MQPLTITEIFTPVPCPITVGDSRRVSLWISQVQLKPPAKRGEEISNNCASLSVPDVWASVEVSNSTGLNALNGINYTLTCTVSRIFGMNLVPSLEWVGPNDEVIVSGGNVIMGEVEHEGAVSSLTLSFIPVSFSHKGNYTCRAAVTVPWYTTQQLIPRSVSVDMPVKGK